MNSTTTIDTGEYLSFLQTQKNYQILLANNTLGIITEIDVEYNYPYSTMSVINPDESTRLIANSNELLANRLLKLNNELTSIKSKWWYKLYAK